MKEADVCLEIKHSIERLPGAFYYKIPDSPRFVGSGVRFSPMRPFDCFGLYKGIPFAFEVKYHGSPDAFAFSKVADHQLRYLLRFARAGADSQSVVSGLLICTWPEKESPRNLWYFDVKDWVGLSDSYQHPHYGYEISRKSILVVELYDEGIRVPWLGKGLWDFQKIFAFYQKNT